MKAINNLKVKIFLSLLKKCKKGNLTITTPDNEIIEIKKTQDVFADIHIAFGDWSHQFSILPRL